MKRCVVVALLWLAIMGGADASSFGRPYRLSTVRALTSDVAIGDVNGDGRKDVVATKWNASVWDYTLSLYLQRADGTLASPLDVRLPRPEQDIEYRLTTADLDGDGRDEIVTAGPENGLTVVRLAPGGTTSVTVHPDPPYYGCRYITAGDVDRDGNPDIACHDVQVRASVYFGDGKGGFRSRIVIPTQAGWYGIDDFKTIQLADVTGDGYQDLLVSAGASTSFHVAANNRMGGFLPATAYPHPPSSDGNVARSVAIVATDIDNDGVNEVLTATPAKRPESTVNVYRRGAYGFLELSQRIPVYDTPIALLAGDVGDDGDVDAIALHYIVGGATVLGEKGSGLAGLSRYELPGFGNHTETGYIPSQYGVALGDIDGDACIDLAAATWSGVILLYGCESFRTSIPVSDFDGDGISDVLWYHTPTAQQWLWQQADIEAWDDCMFNQYPYQCPNPLGQLFLGQAVGDFDGDGLSDAFWRDPVTGDNRITFRAFNASPVTRITNQDWQVVGAGDFDGDDSSDLLWRNRRSGANAIWRSANYSAQMAVRGVADPDWRVAAVGDFDGDGRSDIFWRHAMSGGNVVWRSGRYETQISVTAVTSQNWKIRGVGDFNGDRRDDLVWRNTQTGANAIWLAGNSRAQRSVTAVTNRDWDIAAIGDYNGDGASDLLWRNARTGANTIWRSGLSGAQQRVEPFEPTSGLTVAR